MSATAETIIVTPADEAAARHSLSPWSLVLAVTVPFWLFMAATRVFLFIATQPNNPLVIIAPPSVRFAQHLLLLPVLLLCYRLALLIGWPKKHRLLALGCHAVLALVFALAARPALVFPTAWHSADWSLLQELFASRIPEPDLAFKLWLQSGADFLMSYLFGLALVFGTLTFRELKYEKLRTARLEGEWMRARLQALRMQLNPHFLFNTLNAAVAVVRSRPNTAEQMLLGLADLLRRAFRDEEGEQVPLQREAEFVRKYLEIQRLRFGDRLQIDIDIPPQTQQALVPGLLLQPLAENAVVHGVTQESNTVRISIRAQRAGEYLVIEVENSAPPQTTKAHGGSGIGLGATRERLRAMYGHQQQLEIARGADGTTIVARIRLPFVAAPARIAA